MSPDATRLIGVGSFPEQSPYLSVEPSDRDKLRSNDEGERAE
jgi:hypothetical protein